jgi:hypothetical protein
VDEDEDDETDAKELMQEIKSFSGVLSYREASAEDLVSMMNKAFGNVVVTKEELMLERKVQPLEKMGVQMLQPSLVPLSAVRESFLRAELERFRLLLQQGPAEHGAINAISLAALKTIEDTLQEVLLAQGLTNDPVVVVQTSKTGQRVLREPAPGAIGYASYLIEREVLREYLPKPLMSRLHKVKGDRDQFTQGTGVLCQASKGLEYCTVGFDLLDAVKTLPDSTSDSTKVGKDPSDTNVDIPIWQQQQQQQQEHQQEHQEQRQDEEHVVGGPAATDPMLRDHRLEIAEQLKEIIDLELRLASRQSTTDTPVAFPQLRARLLGKRMFDRLDPEADSLLILETKGAMCKHSFQDHELANKKVVVLIGQTGSGKSTAGNWLLGMDCVMQTELDSDGESDSDGEVSLSLSGRVEAEQFATNHSLTTSTTFLPGIAKIPGRDDAVLIDFPDFFDSNGPEVRIGIDLAFIELINRCLALNSTVHVLAMASIRSFAEGRMSQIRPHFAKLQRLLSSLSAPLASNELADEPSCCRWAVGVTKCSSGFVSKKPKKLWRKFEADFREVFESANGPAIKVYDMNKHMLQIVKKPASEGVPMSRAELVDDLIANTFVRPQHNGPSRTVALLNDCLSQADVDQLPHAKETLLRITEIRDRDFSVMEKGRQEQEEREKGKQAVVTAHGAIVQTTGMAPEATRQLLPSVSASMSASESEKLQEEGTTSPLLRCGGFEVTDVAMGDWIIVDSQALLQLHEGALKELQLRCHKSGLKKLLSILLDLSSVVDADQTNQRTSHSSNQDENHLIPVCAIMADGTTHALGELQPTDSIWSVKQLLESISGVALSDMQMHLTDDKRPENQDLRLLNEEVLQSVLVYATSETELQLGVVVHPISRWSSTTVDLQIGVASALKGEIDAELQFYEAAADNVRVPVHSLDRYCAHAHLEDGNSWNEVSSYRVISDTTCTCFSAGCKAHVPALAETYWNHNLFPYVGIATNRRDLAMHPPSDGQSLAPGGYTVCAFVCPLPGTYTIKNIAIKSVVHGTQGPIFLHVSHDRIEDATASSSWNLATCTTYPVQHLDWIGVEGNSADEVRDMYQQPMQDLHYVVKLDQGSRIYFAVKAHGGGFSCGAVRIKWDITHRLE